MLRTLVTIVSVFVGFVDCKSEKELVKHLLADYELTARPVKDPRTSINISIDLDLVFIQELIEREQVLSLYAWFDMRWHDDYLQWSPEEWEGIRYLIIPSKFVWDPDLIIRNSVISVRGDILDEGYNSRYTVYSNGSVLKWTAGKMKTSCHVDMTYFPFDDQACSIQVDSWSYAMDTVRLVNVSDKINLNFHKPNGQWTVMKTETQEVLEMFDDQSAYSLLKFIIYLRRKPTYYLYNIIFPSIILSFLVLMVFLVPADAGEKISLGITILLSFTVFQLIIADNMPKTSDYVPILAVYILCTMVMTGVSLICTVLVLNIHHHNPDQPPPRWLRCAMVKIAKMCCVTTSLVQVKNNRYRKKSHTWASMAEEDIATRNIEVPLPSEDLKQVNANLEYFRRVHEESDESEGHRHDWIEVARICDRILIFFFLIYLVVTVVTLFGIYPLTKPVLPLLK